MLKLAEVDKPVPKAKEVLVKIRAASVNSWDWDLVRGKPRIYRLLFGIFKPKYPIIGSDIAGTVEAIGSEVVDLKPGDAVFGDISGSGFGAFAEYVCAPAKLLAKKPEGMSFEQAAAIPQAGVLALQGLRQGKVEQAKKVLINGAGGGVGTFAIQMARMHGAEVTAVDRPEKFDLMHSLGADHVLDYTQTDFTKTGRTYDLILDMVADRSVWDYARALNKNGIYSMVGGKPGHILQIALLGRWAARSKRIGILAHKLSKADLETLARLVTENRIRPIIDKTYALDEAGRAVQHLGDSNVQGKLVIRISA